MRRPRHFTPGGSPQNDAYLVLLRYEIQAEMVSSSVRIPMEHVHLSRREDLMRRELVYQLSAMIPRLKEQGVLTVQRPATWWQHAKQAAYKRFPWFLRPAIGAWPVRLHEDRYLASRFVPAVEMPAEALRGSFCTWTAAASAHPPPPPNTPGGYRRDRVDTTRLPL